MSRKCPDQLQPHCAKSFRSFFLVLIMFGVEASLSLEHILMIANIQTLGVPTSLSSIQGTASAVISILLIPTLGYVMDRWATSKQGKANILIFGPCIQFIGNVLIFIANVVKLWHCDNSKTPQSELNLTDEHAIAGIEEMYSPSFSSMINTTIETIFMDTRYTSSNNNSSDVNPTEDSSVHYYAILAMIGYAMLDCGYDATTCFLKTFVLASTPPEEHAHIIIKSMFVASLELFQRNSTRNDRDNLAQMLSTETQRYSLILVNLLFYNLGSNNGGCLVAVLVSTGLGGLLTTGTLHDTNAAQCAFLSALCFLLLLIGLPITLSTGFCCSPSCDSTDASFEVPRDEKSQLIISSQALRTKSAGEECLGDQNDSGFYEDQSGNAIHKQAITEHIEWTHQSGIVGLIVRQKKHIILNVAYFFISGALDSYQIYSINFVGQGIFLGDPDAETNSEGYINYITGIEMGSSGHLVYYITSVVANMLQGQVLKILGWKLEMIIVCSGYVAFNFLCALTFTLWSYYILCVCTGVFRSVVISVPYILANQFAMEQSGAKNTGVAIAVVASMTPCGLILCSAVMGPLIELTGNPATSVYYTAAGTFLGLIVILFLK